MTVPFQLTMDAGDPTRLATFWAEALGYVEDPAPEGFDDWESALIAWGVPRDRWNDSYAIVDPDGRRPRIFVQRVPEPKTAKNRLHIDIESGAGGHGQPKDWNVLRSTAARLVEKGASVHVEFNEPGEGEWIVMLDPEGNEFCIT